MLSFWFWLIFMQNIGVKDNRFCYRYVVVFQYGSAVLFNIADHEAEYYLDIIRKHASGWLPEMRKDGMTTAKLCLFTAFYLPPFLCSLIIFALTDNSTIAFCYIQRCYLLTV